MMTAADGPECLQSLQSFSSKAALNKLSPACGKQLWDYVSHAMELYRLVKGAGR